MRNASAENRRPATGNGAWPPAALKLRPVWQALGRLACGVGPETALMVVHSSTLQQRRAVLLPPIVASGGETVSEAQGSGPMRSADRRSARRKSPYGGGGKGKAPAFSPSKIDEDAAAPLAPAQRRACR